MSEGALILALLGILLHAVEQKKQETWYMTFERQISERKQIAYTRETGKKKKKATYTFLTTMYHGISSMRSLERNRKEKTGDGGRKRHKQETQTKRSHFDENFAASMFPVKGDVQLVWCLA